MKKYITICMLSAAGALAGCSSGTIVVKEKPVELVYEKPAPPDPNYVWRAPGYVVKDGKYEFRSGRWVAPPNTNRRWVDGRWKETKRGWVWVNGYWK